MFPSLAALALAAAALACAAPSAAPAQELGPPLIKAATPCAVGQAIAAYWMQQGGGARRIFDDQPVVSGLSDAAPADISPKLFDKWRSGPAVSLLDACPDTRKAVEAFGPFATPDERLRASGVQHGPYLVRIGAPVANRTDLIIAIQSQCAGMCGYGGVLHYRKTAEGWVRMAPLAIVLG